MLVKIKIKVLTGPYDYMNEKMWICFGDNGYNKLVYYINFNDNFSLKSL